MPGVSRPHLYAGPHGHRAAWAVWTAAARRVPTPRRKVSANWGCRRSSGRAHSARVHHLLGSGGLGRAEVCSIHDSLAVIGVRRAWVARMRRMPFLRMSRRQGGGGWRCGRRACSFGRVWWCRAVVAARRSRSSGRRRAGRAGIRILREPVDDVGDW